MGVLLFIGSFCLCFGFAIGNLFTSVTAEKERQKWCQHYHSEYKKVEACLEKPDYEGNK